MTVIEIPDDQAALKARAEAQGLTLEAWLQRLAGTDAPAKPARRNRYTLAELMPQCDLSAPLSDEDRLWLDAPPVGREV